MSMFVPVVLEEILAISDVPPGAYVLAGNHGVPKKSSALATIYTPGIRLCSRTHPSQPINAR